MTLKEEFKILRTELSKNPEPKVVPEFIISGLDKLGYRTDDLTVPQSDGSVTFRGNEWLVFGVGETYNKLEEAYLQVATILKNDAQLSKISHDWLYGLEKISDHKILAKRAFQEVGLHLEFCDLQADYKKDKFLFNHLQDVNKDGVKYILENPKDVYRIPMKMSYDVNNSIYSGNLIADLEKENKPKTKIKP
ncbi:hypothetical protein PSE10A_46670 [Pseudomonas amygdali pv. eriobotryae]|uniref:Uncharacterized protein n=1 Tax=Pseudomonas amygdali pv. eriobotryae TaxID=129137 RepID=A0A9P3AIA6_PSEA0|nr:hypothetical protein [Pseudomonas amygdali]GFZ62156.1 hypothetical protein PSE10A_46670 [Pseudomonas amygdali pv. eriobotryae]